MEKNASCIQPRQVQRSQTSCTNMARPLCNPGPFHTHLQFSSVQSLSCVRLFATPWIAARQDPLSMTTPRVHSNSCPLSQWCHPAGPSSQGYGFSSGHVWMWELDCKKSWALKNWCFWTHTLLSAYSQGFRGVPWNSQWRRKNSQLAYWWDGSVFQYEPKLDCYYIHPHQGGILLAMGRKRSDKTKDIYGHNASRP